MSSKESLDDLDSKYSAATKLKNFLISWINIWMEFWHVAERMIVRQFFSPEAAIGNRRLCGIGNERKLRIICSKNSDWAWPQLSITARSGPFRRAHGPSQCQCGPWEHYLPFLSSGAPLQRSMHTPKACGMNKEAYKFNTCDRILAYNYFNARSKISKFKMRRTTK